LVLAEALKDAAQTVRRPLIEVRQRGRIANTGMEKFSDAERYCAISDASLT